MVNNVAKLTRSLRDGMMRENAQTPLSSHATLAERRAIVLQELGQRGEAIFVDDSGNRFRIERKSA
jgi:hypothetical protein